MHEFYQIKYQGSFCWVLCTSDIELLDFLKHTHCFSSLSLMSPRLTTYPPYQLPFYQFLKIVSDVTSSKKSFLILNSMQDIVDCRVQVYSVFFSLGHEFPYKSVNYLFISKNLTLFLFSVFLKDFGLSLYSKRWQKARIKQFFYFFPQEPIL